jgi:signal transduction histidine kinase
VNALAVPDAAELAARFGADGAIIYGIEGQELTIVDIWPVHPSASSLVLQVGFGVTGRVARTRAPLLLDEDSPRNVLHRQLLRLEPTQTVARMCLPLPGLDPDGGIVGVLALHRHPRRPFTADDLDRAEGYAPLLGLRIQAEQLWRTVNRHRTERDRLIKQAISAQEAERRRIAFDLHDGVTTALASMSFHLSAADLTVSDVARRAEAEGAPLAALGRARAELVSARELADLAYQQTRAAISGLHSLVLDDLGLVAAIESLVQNAAGPGGPEIEVLVDPSAGLEELPDHVAAALYRIVQEALANAVKHAGAQRIVVSVRRVGDSIVLGCADDGAGFDPTERRATRAADADGQQHFGLASIEERCAMIEASLRVESVPGRGTTVLVEVPL